MKTKEVKTEKIAAATTAAVKSAWSAFLASEKGAVLKRLTPADLRRLGELTGRALTPAESTEKETLLLRLEKWGEFRDIAGTVFRDSDGRPPFTERRLQRVARVRTWQRKRDKDQFERVLSAVEARGNVFARCGDLWLVSFGGQRSPLMEDKKGMAYIHALLTQNDGARKGEGLTPAELCGEVNLSPLGLQPAAEQGEDTPTPGTVADGRSIDHADEMERRRYMRDPEIQKHLRELKDNLRDAIADGDALIATHIRRKLREYGEGDPSGTRRPRDKRTERPRDAVRRAIERALSEIRKRHPRAAAYLTKHLETERARWHYTGESWTT
ncbi:MAG: hypothetical protein WCN95_13835 [bacterium]